jgi:S1-C subfamily serine protease
MSNPINDFSNALAALVEQAAPSVVRVDARRWVGSSGIVWSAEGHIVTASHSVRGEQVEVGLPEGITAPATLVGRDPSTDLALLKADMDGLKVPVWVEPDGLKVGQVVLALGKPGKNVRASLGILSNLGEEWRTPLGGKLERYIQPDVSLYPGFSGGPLLDAEGRFLGMNTRALRRDLALTIPTPTLKRVIERLIRHGGVRRGYLGVGAQPVRLPPSAAQESGLLLVSVEPGSPAEAGGLMLGDILLAINANPLRRLDDLLAQLAEMPAGTSVSLRILRGGQIQDASLTLGERR